MRPMVWMVARFAMVGVIATAVHAAILALGIERFEVLPPIATVFGFLGGVGTSKRSMPSARIAAWTAVAITPTMANRATIQTIGR
ncbi:MAG: hypothetical protein AAFU81_13495, partial [Pseudomonadota bacterium]